MFFIRRFRWSHSVLSASVQIVLQIFTEWVIDDCTTGYLLVSSTGAVCRRGEFSLVLYVCVRCWDGDNGVEWRRNGLLAALQKRRRRSVRRERYQRSAFVFDYVTCACYSPLCRCLWRRRLVRSGGGVRLIRRQRRFGAATAICVRLGVRERGIVDDRSDGDALSRVRS